MEARESGNGLGDFMPYYIYILECADGSYYTGITTDVERRLAAHRSGKGSRYVASRLPCEVVYVEESPSRSAALKRELAIKKMTHRQKQALLTANRH